jgi:hypothetical protein
MRKTFLWVLALTMALVFAAVVVQAKEDLGALSKKEKARREAIEKNRTKEKKEKKVYTNDDIPNIKSEIGIIGSADDSNLQVGGDEAPAAGSPEDFDLQIRRVTEERDALQEQIDSQKANITGGNNVMSANPSADFDKLRQDEEKLGELNNKITDLQDQKAKAEEQAAARAQKSQGEPPPEGELGSQQQPE